MARLKDLIELSEDLGVISSATSSQTIDVGGVGGQVLACQVNADVQSGNKTFDSGADALLIVQDLTYTAITRGTAGNSITIQYIGDGTAGAETVNVTASAIAVHMDPTAVVGSTATQIRTAVLASGPAAALVGVSVSGTGSNVQAVAAATPLASGVDPEVNVSANTVSVPSHGYINAAKVRLTATGTLPAGLATSTDYYLIVVDASTLKFATSAANAAAGTAIDITDQGSDGNVSTIAPVAISGASVKLQKSNDNSNWIDEGSATNITADASIALEKVDPAFRYYKAVFAISAGSVDIINKWLVKGIDG